MAGGWQYAPTPVSILEDIADLMVEGATWPRQAYSSCTFVELGLGDYVIDNHNNWPRDGLHEHTVWATFCISRLQLGSIVDGRARASENV